MQTLAWHFRVVDAVLAGTLACRTMRRMKANPAWWMLLALLLGAMLTILVMPEVELPDSAFYTNTAPAMLHARVAPSRAPLLLLMMFLVSFAALNREPRRLRVVPLRAQSRSLPILYRSLLR